MTSASIARLEFRPLSWSEFRREHENNIRAVVVFDRIVRPRMGLTMVLDGTPDLFMVKYTGGDWRDGRPVKAPEGIARALIRIPAVKVAGRLLALDGCHRLLLLRPRVVVVDWFEPKAFDRCYLNDLFNTFWRK